MKKEWFVAIAALVTSLVLILSTYILREDRTDLPKTDYSAMLQMQTAMDAPETQPLPENKEAGYRDKSFATGVDSSPTLSVG